ncbi:MAG: LysM peptidoglycan-binding domain-containing protein [Flavobacterium sp.]|nr:LysM peptidoglycan-binding domain-containing protein [Flavobacterium sp.]
MKGATLQLGTIVTLPNTLIVKNTIEKPQFHKVKKGESFYSISKKYNLSVNDLELLNPSIETNKLKEGEKLSISKKEQAESIEIKKEEITQVKTEKIA